MPIEVSFQDVKFVDVQGAAVEKEKQEVEDLYYMPFNLRFI